MRSKRAGKAATGISLRKSFIRNWSSAIQPAASDGASCLFLSRVNCDWGNVVSVHHQLQFRVASIALAHIHRDVAFFAGRQAEVVVFPKYRKNLRPALLL